MRHKPGMQYVTKKEICLEGVRSVVLLGDNGCRPPTPQSIAVFKKILKLKTDLFIIVGDLVFKGRDDELKKLLKFCKQRVKVPIFTVAGNHDLPGYYKFCGSSTYAIILDNFGFICLDNSKRKFFKKDTAFLERELKKHKEKKFFILFHIPPPLKFDKSHIDYFEWKKIKRVLDKFKKRVICVFCGHLHAYLNYRLDGYRIFITGGGGAYLFNMKEDRLKARHALKFDFQDKDFPSFQIIPAEGKKKPQKVKL